MDRFDQTIQKSLAVLVASALALGIFAPNEVKAQQASGSGESGGPNGAQDTGQDHTGQDFTSPQNLFPAALSV